MAASQPRRGASVDQAQRLYTIRPLKWYWHSRPADRDGGVLRANSPIGFYTIWRTPDRKWVGRFFSFAAYPHESSWINVSLCRRKGDAKLAALRHCEKRLHKMLKPAGKAVRRG